MSRPSKLKGDQGQQDQVPHEILDGAYLIESDETEGEQEEADGQGSMVGVIKRDDEHEQELGQEHHQADE